MHTGSYGLLHLPAQDMANSLRNKNMGVQSLPRRQSVYPGVHESSPEALPPLPRVRPKDKSKVESLMKRRYSMARGMGVQNHSNEAFPVELSSRSKEFGQSIGEVSSVPVNGG